MRVGAAVAIMLVVALSGHAQAAGAVTVVAGSVSIAEFPPSAGSDTVRKGSSPLRFSNEGATERELVIFTASHVLAYEQGGSASGSVTFQGEARAMSSLFFAAQSASGDFLPLRVTTAADRTGEAGWTKHAQCGAVTYQGDLSIAWFTNAGAAQTPLARHYQVCDGIRIFVDADKDMSSGADFAYVSTSSQVLAGEADYEITLQGVDFAFTGAGSASAVTLDQARYLGAPVPSATTVDLHPLYRFPDGFPAGVVTTTVTASAQTL